MGIEFLKMIFGGTPLGKNGFVAENGDIGVGHQIIWQGYTVLQASVWALPCMMMGKMGKTV